MPRNLMIRLFNKIIFFSVIEDESSEPAAEAETSLVSNFLGEITKRIFIQIFTFVTFCNILVTFGYICYIL